MEGWTLLGTCVRDSGWILGAVECWAGNGVEMVVLLSGVHGRHCHQLDGTNLESGRYWLILISIYHFLAGVYELYVLASLGDVM